MRDVGDSCAIGDIGMIRQLGVIGDRNMIGNLVVFHTLAVFNERGLFPDLGMRRRLRGVERRLGRCLCRGEHSRYGGRSCDVVNMAIHEVLLCCGNSISDIWRQGRAARGTFVSWLSYRRD